MRLVGATPCLVHWLYTFSRELHHKRGVSDDVRFAAMYLCASRVRFVYSKGLIRSYHHPARVGSTLGIQGAMVVLGSPISRSKCISLQRQGHSPFRGMLHGTMVVGRCALESGNSGFRSWTVRVTLAQGWTSRASCGDFS
ncbi:unnamed protein product [Amoebophrya sp. A120]|nr:unnamed protein product [Amoebophrya sp. A120]|eukprot:GSA120T00001995001.1